MGSEMCIRDRPNNDTAKNIKNEKRSACLLYTSDAADDMQCVDLGGRRIIKKRRTSGRGAWGRGVLTSSMPREKFFQAEDGIRDVERSRGLGDVYKRQTKQRLKLQKKTWSVVSRGLFAFPS